MVNILIEGASSILMYCQDYDFEWPSEDFSCQLLFVKKLLINIVYII